jgi:DMSO reductase anchor subunit
MRPALSIVFFTTLSGAGYGLWMWLGMVLALGASSTRGPLLAALACGFVLSTIGLLCSVAHLGQPQRAWRALSQWRSSWLSREGVAALACAAVAMGVFALLWHGGTAALLRIAGGALAVIAAVVVFCTARIYSSLPTIAAWRDARVAPAFLILALGSGALWLWTLLAWMGADGVAPMARTLALVGAGSLLAGAAFVKVAYWRAIDAAPSESTGAATGLDRFGHVRASEHPHTEANYLTHEMGFVLARRHSARLRRIVVASVAVLPITALVATVAWPDAAVLLAPFALASASLGVFVERWLFFAEARHVVMRYYGAHAGQATTRG